MTTKGPGTTDLLLGDMLLRVKEDVRPLPVRLTEEELLARGQQLAQVHQRAGEHEAHADSVKKDLKAKEQELVSEASRIAAIIRNKAEPREVRVASWHDLERKRYYETREDTGEQIFDRPLRPEELQQDLDLQTKQAATTKETN